MSRPIIAGIPASANIKLQSDMATDSIVLAATARQEPPQDPGALAVLALMILKKRKVFIAQIVSAAILLGLGYALIVGPTYTASAVILVEPEAGAQAGSVPVLNETTVQSQADLLRSQGLARQVVEQLRLDKAFEPGLLRKIVNKLVGTANENEAFARSRVDGAAGYLFKGLKVESDRRSTLISVSFTSSNPPESASIANAFVSVYLHNVVVRQLAEQYSSAKKSLAELLLTLGVRHPDVLRAQERVAFTEAQVLSARKGNVLLSSRQLSDTGRIIPAEAGSVSNSSLSVTIAQALAFGLVLAILGALFLERSTVFEAWRNYSTRL